MKRILLAFCLYTFAATIQAQPDFLIDSDWLADHVDDENLVVLEVRYHPHRYYTVGHIPGAVNVVSLDGTDGQSQKWLSDDALANLYRHLPNDKTIYVYCHDGFRMSLAYLQLKHLGVKDIRLYNGGWSHWGNELTLPVVEGEDSYSGDYEL